MRGGAASTGGWSDLLASSSRALIRTKAVRRPPALRLLTISGRSNEPGVPEPAALAGLPGGRLSPNPAAHALPTPPTPSPAPPPTHTLPPHPPAAPPPPAA